MTCVASLARLEFLAVGHGGRHCGLHSNGCLVEDADVVDLLGVLAMGGVLADESLGNVEVVDNRGDEAVEGVEGSVSF